MELLSYLSLLISPKPVPAGFLSFFLRIVKDVYQFPQSTVRQKGKDNYNCKPQWRHD